MRGCGWKVPGPRHSGRARKMIPEVPWGRAGAAPDLQHERSYVTTGHLGMILAAPISRSNSDSAASDFCICFQALINAFEGFLRGIILAAGHAAGGRLGLLKISRREVDMMEQQIFSEDHHCLGRGSSRTVSDSGDTCCYKSKRPDLGGLALGQLLWAKAVLSSWWPAQIVDERAISESNIINQRIQGGVLVRFYGSYDFAWVDPLAELSQFEESFKGKNFNTRTAFQKALEDALLQNKMISPEKWDGRPRCSTNPSQPNQSGEQPARKAPSCKRKKGDEHEQNKGPRKRKEKVPFKEEETVTDTSEQKGRRMRVMRHLGLAAPPGSPFSADSPVKIAA